MKARIRGKLYNRNQTDKIDTCIVRKENKLLLLNLLFETHKITNYFPKKVFKIVKRIFP